MDTKQQTLGSMAFPMERSVLQSLEEFLKKGHDYIQLSIGNVLYIIFNSNLLIISHFLDLKNESILLKKKGMFTIEELPSLVPEDEARYHLFRSVEHLFRSDEHLLTINIIWVPVNSRGS